MRSFYLFSLLLLSLSFSLPSYGTHLTGAELTYSCINPCTIRVTLDTYRDCAGASTISANSFIFTPDSANCAVPVPLNTWPAPVITELTPFCASYTPTNCTDPNSPFRGIQEYHFERDYDVCQAGNCTFTMSWSTCCRSSAITSGSSNQGTYIGTTTFNNTLASCNSSPVFSSLPATYICQGQSTVLSMGATDPDGDSLSFSFGPCYSNQGAQTTYNAGYSINQPLGPTWGVTIDPATGDISFNAMGGDLEIGTICVYVQEWRNGQVINSIVRDYMISVIPCPNVLCGSNRATGKVYKDDNSNCIADAADPNLFGFQLFVIPDSIIVPTDANGNFVLNPQPGTYTIAQIPSPTGLWQQTCPAALTYTITFPSLNDTINGLDFGNEGLIDCPYMWVDIAPNRIRPCFSSTFYVDYCNQGTDSAYNASIDVTLDSNYTYVSSTIPLTSSSGNTYSFNVGDLGPTECGSFSLVADLACDTTLDGRTLCAEAHAFPDSSCFPVNPVWDSSNVEILGYCNGDSLVCFTVYNTSGGNMQGPTSWRLYENGVLVTNGTLQLCAACDTTMCFPANGNTIRLEVDQRPGHPSASTPTATVELCGQPNSAINLVNILPQPDADPYISIHCGQALFSYDPNSKYVWPSGVDPQYHYVDSSDALEYMIDFQNTGNADAIHVTLTDTLSPFLDLQSIVPGVSSHSYTWEVLSGRRLRFNFQNINLVPASQDSTASIGFVKFKVKQRPGNGTGARIENTADIVFDYNAPIRTNTVFSTIGWPVVISVDLEPVAAAVKVYPNPATGEVFAEVEGMEMGRALDFELYSIMGQRVLAGSFESGQRYRADLQNLPQGVYIYRILDQDRMVKAGKLLVEY